MDGGTGSGFPHGARALPSPLSASLSYLCKTKNIDLFFFFPRCFTCCVIASVTIPRVGLTTLPGLVREVLKA